MHKELIHLTHEDVNMQTMVLAEELQRVYKEQLASRTGLRVYGIPRGGIAVLYLLARHLPTIKPVNDPYNADILLDDIVDSGSTMERYAEKYDLPFYSVYDKNNTLPGAWYVFPWEGTALQSADDIPLRLLQYIGEDVNRGGLRDTPMRFLKAWNAYTSGYGVDVADLLRTFEDGAESYEDMVMLTDIPVHSHCEHHLAPFWGTASIAYVPNGRIVGLSKLSRLVDVYGKRLQVQERLTKQIADALCKHLEPKGVAVVLKCRHSCMEFRGIQRAGIQTTTSAMHGIFLDNPEARAEFMALAK